MPTLTPTHTHPWPLPGNQRLAWYAPTRRAFILGNHADKSLLPTDGRPPTPLVQHKDPYANKTTPYDPHLPPADYDDLATRCPDGFHFLPRALYDAAFPHHQWGSTTPVDQALTSGLTNDLPVRHPSSNAIVAFANKRITCRSADDPSTVLGEVKSKSPITATAAAPTTATLYYATNAGDLYAVPVSPDSIGPQKKLASLARPVHSILPTPDGQHLHIAATGLLATLTLSTPKPAITAQLETACRALHWVDDHHLLLNQGLHGLTIIETTPTSLRKVTTHQPPHPIDRLIPSPDTRHLLALHPPPAGLTLYELSASQ